METPTDGRGVELTTRFASAHRATKQELMRQIAFITSSPVVNGVLTSVCGLMAVLNEDRQVLALNDNFLAALGINEASQTLGLRPGDLLRCTHSTDNVAGCGTGEFCSTCGAAIAIVSSLMTNAPIERRCILTANDGDSTADFCFMVKATPLSLAQSRFVLLFLQDVTEQEQRSGLARAFFHDIKNIVMGLDYAINLMTISEIEKTPRLYDRILRLSQNLTKEVNLHSSIVNNSYRNFSVTPTACSLDKILGEIRHTISSHPAATEKRVSIVGPGSPVDLFTDLPLLIRVLTNMLVNALEATDPGGEVKLWIDQAGAAISFRVWNRAVIEVDAAKRIFQRFFSTKQEPGRGLGTYTMKLFGEKFLGGTVAFISTEEDGTIFTLSLPQKPFLTGL